MTAEDASSYLISTLQGFQLGADQAESIVDKYNEVANNFAIDTAGIGEALQRSAASFKAANTDLSQSIALVTTANAVVQNPESVGTMFKTLSARIRGAKTELADLGEEEDEFTQTTSKLRDLVKQLTGFDIMEDEDTFKDIYEILLGIGKEWKNLTDIEQSSLGEALAGKRNANALYAVLNNIDTLEAAYATAENSAKSASKEQENYMKGIQYSIDVFKASVQELWTTLLDNGTVKAVIDFGTKVIQHLTEIADKLGPAGIIGLVTTLLGLLASGKITNDNNPIGRLLKDIPALYRLFKQGGISDGLIKIANGMLNVSEEAGVMASAFTKGEVLADSFAPALGQLGTTATGAATAFSALKVILAKIAPMLGIGAAIGVAIYGAAKAWDYFTITVEEAEEKLNKTKDRVSGLKDEIEKLQQVDYRTVEQENRLKKIEEELSVQEQILAVEQRRVDLEKYGNKFSDYFDKDNSNRQFMHELNSNIKDSQISLNAQYDKNAEKIKKYQAEVDEYNAKITQYQESIRNGDLVPNVGNKKIEELNAKLTKRTEKINDLLIEQSEIEADLNAKAVEYRDRIDEIDAKLKEAREDTTGIHSQSEIDDLEFVRKRWQGLLDIIEERQNTIFNLKPSLEGLDDFSSIISSAFEHTEFDGLEEKLVEIGKAGELTEEKVQETLKQYPNFLKILTQAGMDAETQIADVYAYIMNLADPNRSERTQLANNIASQLITKKNSRGNGNLRSSEIENQRKIQEYLDNLYRENPEGYQIIAGLDIDWTTFDADQAIDRMNDELKKEGPAEVPVETSMSISETVDSINSKLKPALDSLGDVYTQVLSGPDQLIEGSLGSIDLIEQVQKIKSQLDALNDTEGIEVDYAPFEHLVEVLQDTTSTGAEVQAAFNGVATSITNVGIEGTESIKTLISALSDMGITNAPVVAIGHLIDSTEELANAGLDLEKATDAEIEAWAREIAGAEDATQAIALLKMQKILLNQNALNEEASITELMRLAKMAGIATDAIQELLTLQSDIGEAGVRLTEAVKSGQTSQINEATAALGALNNRARDLKNQIQNDITDALTASYKSSSSGSGGGGGGAGKAGSDAGKAYKEGFDEELSKLKESYERGKYFATAA